MTKDQESDERSDERGALLALNGRARRARLLRRGLLALLLLIVLAGGAAFWLSSQRRAETIHYVTREVTRGPLTVTVMATGTLQPTDQVDIGSELSGIVRTVSVDYNDQVKQGQELARLDTDRLQAQVLRSRAALAAAKAQVVEAQATVEETRRKLERTRTLVAGKWKSGSDLDIDKAAFERAQAGLARSRAQVAQAEADLKNDETNLAKAVIYAPIDGIVLSRQVEPGQTVAASFQAPVLFTLAADLKQMELQVDLDEADVGEVKLDQQASFTVDAYPERRFPARVTQVRYAPETVNGVVTYKTLLTVDNGELLLRPGMTATADIVVEREADVLLVPNEALRYAPPVRREAAPRGGILLSRLFPRPAHNTARAPATQERDAAPMQRRLWLLRDGRPQAVTVTIGPSDGRRTRIMRGDLEAGDRVIVDSTGGPS